MPDDLSGAKDYLVPSSVSVSCDRRRKSKMRINGNCRMRLCWLTWLSILLLSNATFSLAYRAGDFVHFSRQGQYHNMRTPWHEELGRHCPRFGMNSEIVLPLPRPVGYTGSDPYKIALQFGREKYGTPWLFVVGRTSKDVPMLNVDLRYSGGDLLGITAKVVPMPEEYLNAHEKIRTDYWDANVWPKHILVRYFWEEKGELDVAGGLYVLFGSGLVLTTFMAIHILQSSKEKLSRFIQETVVASPGPDGMPKND